MNISISHLIAGYIKGEPAIKIPHLELTHEDKVVFIKGSNGSGKTSFLKLFLAFLTFLLEKEYFYKIFLIFIFAKCFLNEF